MGSGMSLFAFLYLSCVDDREFKKGDRLWLAQLQRPQSSRRPLNYEHSGDDQIFTRARNGLFGHYITFSRTRTSTGLRLD